MAAIFQITISNAFFYQEYVQISINISLKFVSTGPINNIPELVQMMAWRRPGNNPLCDPMMGPFTDAYIRHLAPMSYPNLCWSTIYQSTLNDMRQP